MTRALALIAALGLAGCVKPGEILGYTPTPADVCKVGLRGLLIQATGSDADSVAIACAIVK